MKVYIVVRTVGQAFGCCAYILDSETLQTVDSSRLYPYGYKQSAYSEAKGIIAEQGWQLIEGKHMKTTRAAKGYVTGTVVAINVDLSDVYPHLTNLLWEVRDMRLVGGEYLYTLGLLSSADSVQGIIRDIPSDDIHFVA